MSTPYYTIPDWNTVVDNHTGTTYPVVWTRGAPALPVLAVLRRAMRERSMPSSLYYDPTYFWNYPSELGTMDQPLQSCYFGGVDTGGLISKHRAYDLVQKYFTDLCQTPMTSIGSMGFHRADAWLLRPSEVDWTGLMPYHQFNSVPEHMFELASSGTGPAALAALAGYASPTAWAEGGNPFAYEVATAAQAVYRRECLKQMYCYGYGNVGDAEHWQELPWLQTLNYELKYFETDPPYQGTGTWQECMDGYDAAPWTPCDPRRPTTGVAYRADNDVGGYDGASWAAWTVRIAGGYLSLSGNALDMAAMARVFAYSVYDGDNPQLPEYGTYPFELLGQGLCTNTLTMPVFQPPHPSTFPVDDIPEHDPVTGSAWSREKSWYACHMTVDFKVPGGFVLI